MGWSKQSGRGEFLWSSFFLFSISLMQRFNNCTIPTDLLIFFALSFHFLWPTIITSTRRSQCNNSTINDCTNTDRQQRRPRRPHQSRSLLQPLVVPVKGCENYLAVAALLLLIFHLSTSTGLCMHFCCISLQCTYYGISSVYLFKDERGKNQKNVWLFILRYV